MIKSVFSEETGNVTKGEELVKRLFSDIQAKFSSLGINTERYDGNKVVKTEPMRSAKGAPIEGSGLEFSIKKEDGSLLFGAKFNGYATNDAKVAITDENGKKLNEIEAANLLETGTKLKISVDWGHPCFIVQNLGNNDIAYKEAGISNVDTFTIKKGNDGSIQMGYEGNYATFSKLNGPGDDKVKTYILIDRKGVPISNEQDIPKSAATYTSQY